MNGVVYFTTRSIAGVFVGIYFFSPNYYFIVKARTDQLGLFRWLGDKFVNK